MNTSRPGEPTIDRPGWTGPARRMGIASAGGITLIGVCYLAVIASWLVIEGAPGEPIGDPYLAVMEMLTVASAFSILGLDVAIRCFADPLHRTHALAAFGLGVLASGTTMAVHFINLTAVRQAWRAGEIEDYRLVWPLERPSSQIPLLHSWKAGHRNARYFKVALAARPRRTGCLLLQRARRCRIMPLSRPVERRHRWKS